MKIHAKDTFTVSVADGIVLMETTRIRCGDVWDCHPVAGAPHHYAQDYGSHMVFTEAQLVKRVHAG